MGGSGMPAQFVSEDGRTIYGWKIMECKDREAHPAHSWNEQFLVYGPYACVGRKES